MISFLKQIVENIRSIKAREIDEEKFNGYGFMRRVYGVDDMPNFQTILKLSRTDTLTGAFNRLAFDDVIEREIDVARRYDSSLSLVILNIDFFSYINQEHNHIISDGLLREFAAFLTANIRKADILFRWGGDEFLIIMTHTNRQKVEQFVKKMDSKIGLHNFRIVGRITSSIGFTEIGYNENLDDVINRLEYSYTHAKQQRII